MQNVKEKTLIIILYIYAILSIIIMTKNATLYVNIINPIFWSLMYIYLEFHIKNYYIRFSLNKKYIGYMLVISIFFILIHFYIGIIYGFAKSPFNHNFLSIIKNIYTHIVPIISIEIARAIILTKNKNNKFIIVSTTILFILLEIKYNTLINLFNNKEYFFKHICSNIIPLIFSNSIFSFICLNNSYYLNLIYRIITSIIILILPILPNMDWFMTGSLNLLSSVFIYIFFKYIFNKNISKTKKRYSTHVDISYIITFIVSIVLICFMLGIFKYEPISILSNSMIPTFERGDVIIFKKPNEADLKNLVKGSIIIYTAGNKNIAHRVVDIIQDKNTILYRTKGDNNNVADKNLVKIEQIKGVYFFHIKYIGFPSVWLHDFFVQ